MMLIKEVFLVKTNVVACFVMRRLKNENAEKMGPLCDGKCFRFWCVCPLSCEQCLDMTVTKNDTVCVRQ